VLAVLIVLVVHEGEELVIALPAVMLGGAFFLLRWGLRRGPADDDDDEDRDEPPAAAASRAEAEAKVARWGHG
jgi:nitrogen fixation-related uncharacterized protein